MKISRTASAGCNSAYTARRPHDACRGQNTPALPRWAPSSGPTGSSVEADIIKAATAHDSVIDVCSHTDSKKSSALTARRGCPAVLELLGKAPDPARAAKLTRAQVAAALKRARRRDIAGKTDAILAALRGEHLGQPAALTAAYAATARSLIAVITILNAQVKILQEQVRDHFCRHPDAEIYQSQPGLAAILGARVPGESGDDPRRYITAKARKNYGGTSPVTRASGKKKVVAARFIRNDRLAGALMSWAVSSLQASPGARAFYDEQRAKGHDHSDALRRLANRLVGILHGCLKTRTLCDEATAWGHRENLPQSSAAA